MGLGGMLWKHGRVRRQRLRRLRRRLRRVWIRLRVLECFGRQCLLDCR